MNPILEHLLEVYATRSRAELQQILSELSRVTLEATLIDLLTIYFNDVNSSALREWLTLRLAGYQVTEGKLGYNGYRLVGPESQRHRIVCEVKPQNVNCNSKRKLNGGGNFSDYTPERFIKDQQNQPQILVSGFAKGRLLYILEFPWRCIEEHLEHKLSERFPGWNSMQSGKQTWQRESGDYLRSASFSFRHYQNCEDIKIHFCDVENSLAQECLTKPFYRFLRTICRSLNEETRE